MQAYRDPTAWIAIARVDRQRKKKKHHTPKPKKHSGIARYHSTARTGGKVIYINKAEWFCCQMRLINGTDRSNE